MIAFFRPTATKLVFLAEWIAFIVFIAIRGELESLHHVLVVVYPLLFFYLMGCMLAAVVQRGEQVGRGKALLWAGVLIVVDLALKALFAQSLPEGDHIPLVEGWLHLAHEVNYHGVWLLNVFDLRSEGLLLALNFITLLMLPLIYFIHARYRSQGRGSAWADLALLFLLAGTGSRTVEMFWHGVIVDYIQLPGIVTADLKDIYLSMGVGSILAETLTEPTLRWKGWRREWEDIRKLVVSITDLHPGKKKKTNPDGPVE